MLKFGWICSKGYGVMGVLSSWGLISTKFSVPPSGETMRQTPKVLQVKNVLEVPYHPAKFGGARITPAAGVTKNVEFLSVCLFVCLSVTLLNVRDSAPDFAMKRWSTKTILMPLDRERFVVVHRAQLSEIDANWRHH